ncbi:MAG TPA: transglutaminase domain-containing protein, partial [Polyangiaceae bacterium]|nr:transglutaminase domain-containing protein [Polyangiaceae bacterium]
MQRLRLWLPGLVLGSFLGCASGPKGYAEFPKGEPVVLAGRQEGPEVDALVAAFYERPFEASALHSQLGQVLARHPRASRAHEVAAYLALLEADTESALQHFISAASDLDSELTALYLWELDRLTRTVTEDNRIQRLLEALVRQHPSGDVRARANSGLASLSRMRIDLEAAGRHTAELGYLPAWQLIGPFDNDQGKGFLTSYPPESKLALTEEYAGKLLPVRWRTAGTDPTGKVPLDDLLAPKDFALGYLATFVGSETEGPAELRLSVGDAVQVWWNDAQVASEETLQAGASDNVVVPVNMRRGWNKLLIKSCVREGAWSVAARVAQVGGAPWPGMQSRAEPQTYTPAPSPARATSTEFLPPAVTQLASPARREFLSSRFAMATGRRKEIQPPLERLAKLAPQNALGRYHLALAYWDNDELGKAIDALNAGVARHPELGGFLLKRARYYRQKKLWDQALADLRQVALGPNPKQPLPRRRDSSFELAWVYAGRDFDIDQCRELSALSAELPDLAWARMELAQCQDELGYTTLAEAELRAALALEPGDVGANQRLIGLLSRRLDFASALDHNAVLLRLDPFALGWQMQRANIERRRGEREAARAGYERVRAQSPDWSPPYERLADLAYEEGRTADAVALYEQARARNPRSAELIERLAFLEPEERGLADTLVPTDEQIEAAVSGAPKVQALPGSSATVLLDHVVVDIGNDGSAKRIVTRVTRAENQEAADQLTRVDLPRSGTRKVLSARAQSPKGERQEASSILDTTVRFRKIEPGSIVVLQYVHYQPPGAFLPNQFADTRYFQGMRDQLEKVTWVLVHGKERKLEIATRGGVKEEVAEQRDKVVHTFSAEHVPPLLDEPYMPPAADVLSQVWVTTLTTWDEYVRWERALLVDAFRTSPELEALATRLTQGAATPRAKLDQLYHFVAKDIRYQQEYETTIAGVRPHTAPVTLERGYGDCKDKAVLLIQLAKLVGLDVQFAVLRTTNAGQVQRTIPNQQFNHAIVYVPPQAGIEAGFFLDPTTDGLDIGNLRADDQGALALVIDREGAGHQFIPIPYQDPALEYYHHWLRIQIASPVEAKATDAITFRGTSASSLRRSLRNREAADKMLQGFASSLFTGAVLKRREAGDFESLWQPVELELELDVSSAIQRQTDTWRLPLPGWVPDSGASTLATRHTPVRFGPPISTSFRTEAELPAGYRVVQAPEPFEIEHPCFGARRKTQIQGRK